MPEARKPRVAIDGPAGVGKGTTARLVAERLGVPFLDTGSLYRAAALACRDDGHPELTDDERCGIAVREADIEIIDGVAARLNGLDILREIREPFATAGASKVAVHPAVRAALLAPQRLAAARDGGVLEGRDIGTTVLPDADCKIFLTATIKARVERRAQEWRQRYARGLTPEEFVAVEADLRERDERDSGRELSPLRQAEDAIVVDNSDMTLEQTVHCIIGWVVTTMPSAVR